MLWRLLTQYRFVWPSNLPHTSVMLPFLGIIQCWTLKLDKFGIGSHSHFCKILSPPLCSEWQNTSKNALWGFSHDFLRVANFFGLNFGTWSQIWVAQRSSRWPALWPFYNQNACYTIKTTSIALLASLHRKQSHQIAQVILVFVVWTPAKHECEMSSFFCPADNHDAEIGP